MEQLNNVTITIGYPPIQSKKGTPLLSQNRQFQYFSSPTFIYPMIPAYAASLLKSQGYKVHWLDGIAEKQSFGKWFKQLQATNSDFLLLETKTPLIKKHWSLINLIKKHLPKIKVILVGDHVTYLPLESFRNSFVDYVIAGGDYDFVVVNLLNHLYKNEKLEGGIYFREGKKIVNSGHPSLKHNLDSLPFIDRKLTRWKLYAYKNGNYKYLPGTYMYSARDCWWGKCTFCVWPHTLNPLKTYRAFSPERLFAEIKHVVDKYNVKEVFDDAGTFYIGSRLQKFCTLMIESGYNKKVKLGCNLRFKGLGKQELQLMKKAGFRFVLYGMESGNQKTLDKLNKGIKVEDIVGCAKMAKEAELEPHATIMLGYPWESLEDIKNTVNLTKTCLKKGYFSSIQVTNVIPYPGTPLYNLCKKNKWLTVKDYAKYDMRAPVMKIPYSRDKLMKLTRELYFSGFSPHFILRKILSIRSLCDIEYMLISFKKLLSHIVDSSYRP